MDSFPPGCRGTRLDSEGEPPESCEELTLAVLRYLNLCSEEFYLCRQGYLAKDVWDIWEAELKRTLASPLLRREWKQIKYEFSAYPEFSSFVDLAQDNKAPSVAATHSEHIAVPAALGHGA
jgi:hypothetical protein